MKDIFDELMFIYDKEGDLDKINAETLIEIHNYNAQIISAEGWKHEIIGVFFPETMTQLETIKASYLLPHIGIDGLIDDPKLEKIDNGIIAYIHLE
jgi:hypothetical protein